MLKKLDKCLVICSAILLVIGLVMIFSASNVTSYMTYAKSPYNFFIRQLIFLIGSLIISFFILKINTKTYHYFSFLLMIVIMCLLVVVLVYGKMTNKARSWFNLFGLITIQPSEFAKIITIMWFSCYYSIKKNCLKFRKVIIPLLFAFFNALLIAIQPDLGTTILYVGIVFMMFLVLPIAKKIKRNSFLGVLGVVLVALLLLLNNGVKILFERQLERFNFLNPCERIYSTGNQVCNGYIAINNGGLFGKGLGNSTQKYLYLPEAYTDFIFAIIVEELGLLVSIGILILLFLVLWRIFIIAKRSKTTTRSLLCYGIFWYIILHVIVNLGGLLGLMPLTGVPLPFLSYGGSYLMCLISSIAIVLRVDIENKSTDLKENE